MITDDSVTDAIGVDSSSGQGFYSYSVGVGSWERYEGLIGIPELYRFYSLSKFWNI